MDFDVPVNGCGSKMRSNAFSYMWPVRLSGLGRAGLPMGHAGETLKLGLSGGRGEGPVVWVDVPIPPAFFRPGPRGEFRQICDASSGFSGNAGGFHSHLGPAQL